jgi:hypothetical protein
MAHLNGIPVRVEAVATSLAQDPGAAEPASAAV